MGWFGPTKAEKAAAEKAAAEKGSDRHLWQAAFDNNKPELKRLIGLGWNVNWHNPEVRRRMRLAWAPASFRLYMLEAAFFLPTAQRAAAPPARRALHTRPRRACWARRPPASFC